jgi:hypothetical protein
VNLFSIPDDDTRAATKVHDVAIECDVLSSEIREVADLLQVTTRDSDVEGTVAVRRTEGEVLIAVLSRRYPEDPARDTSMLANHVKGL